MIKVGYDPDLIVWKLKKVVSNGQRGKNEKERPESPI